MSAVTISVKQPSAYDIIVQNGLLENCGKIIKEKVKGNTCIIMTDTNVEPLYLDIVTNSLTAAGFDLILKGEDAASLTPERVAEKLTFFIETAKAARKKINPFWENSASLSDEEFVSRFPHYLSFI